MDVLRRVKVGVVLIALVWQLWLILYVGTFQLVSYLKLVRIYGLQLMRYVELRVVVIRWPVAIYVNLLAYGKLTYRRIRSICVSGFSMLKTMLRQHGLSLRMASIGMLGVRGRKLPAMVQAQAHIVVDLTKLGRL